MIALGILGFVVVLSFLTSFYLYRARLRVRLLHLAPPDRAFRFSTFRLAFLFLVYWAATFAVLNIGNWYYPVTNDPIFSNKGSITVNNTKASVTYQFVCRGLKCTNKQVDVLRSVSVDFAFPESVPVRQEFVVSADVWSDMGFPADTYVAELFKPSTLEGRTTDVCRQGQEPKSLSVEACVVLENSADNLGFRWTLSPSETGKMQLTVKSDDIRFQNDPRARTKGAITVSHQGLEHELSQEDPLTKIANVEIDGVRGEIRFELDVLTTLGVSQRTFDIMKSIGAIVSALAAMFGAGFALKLHKRSSSSI